MRLSTVDGITDESTADGATVVVRLSTVDGTTDESTADGATVVVRLSTADHGATALQKLRC